VDSECRNRSGSHGHTAPSIMFKDSVQGEEPVNTGRVKNQGAEGTGGQLPGAHERVPGPSEAMAFLIGVQGPNAPESCS